MKAGIEVKSLNALLDSTSYREFIRVWIEERSRVRRFGFADIARHGSFSSRSFPRDVSIGSKRLTLRSLDRFAKGMGLSGDWAAYFKLLVVIEEPGCRTGNLDLEKLERSRNALRMRLQSKAGIRLKDLPKDEVFLEEFPRIYAGLGTKESGAKLGEISRRTGLSVTQLRVPLAKGVQNGWVRQEKDRYFASLTHVSLEGLQTSFPFRTRFQRSCGRAVKEVETRLDSHEALFFSSAFSVRASDLPELKDDLRGLLLRYVESAEHSGGDRVVELITALV